MQTQSARDGLRPDTTDLERRVLAHERILQSLIAYMSCSEPRFVEHLKTRFVDTMSMARREQDYTDVDDYAEEFIRAVMEQTDICTPPQSRSLKPASAVTQPFVKHASDTTQVSSKREEPDRVRVTERRGVWEVRVDGTFLGNYNQPEHARTAAALARFSLK
jgi:hypothetical protein